MGKELRPYQIGCIEASISEYQKGIVRQCAALFTGAGKTFTSINLIDEYKQRFGFKRALWLCYQSELVDQSGLAFLREKYDTEFCDLVEKQGFIEYTRKNEFPGHFKMGLVKEQIFEIDADVVMGSVMTLHNRLDRIDPYHFDIIICDEFHLFGSNSAVKVLNHFVPKLLLGITATPIRTDGMMLSDIVQKIVFEYDLGQGIKDGYACELDAIRIKTNVSLDRVKTTAGEFNLGDLTNEVNTLARNQLIVDSYKKYCEGRQCIAFCVDIKHAMDLAEQFRMNGYDCQAVSSNEELTPDRSENIKRYKNGDLQIITNVNLLTMGFDRPDTGCVIMACPTKSITKYLQAVGRGSRLKSEEYVSRFGQNALILDIVDVTSRHNIINAWELDKQKSVEDRVFVSKEKKEKLLEARKAKITHERKEDQHVSLLQIPRLKIAKFYTMSDDATQAQLDAIAKWGYDIKNTHYTKFMITEIFAEQPATPKQIGFLRWKGYDVDGDKMITRGMFEAAMKEIKKKDLTKNIKPF
jgi:superfamily II DNA or RNA helicase